jgi:hypothetical protein
MNLYQLHSIDGLRIAGFETDFTYHTEGRIHGTFQNEYVKLYATIHHRGAVEVTQVEFPPKEPN